MSRSTAAVVGALVGGVLGLLTAIAYDTSANVAPLEGARRHLTFVGVLIVAAVFAAIGAAVAGATFARRP